MELYENGQASLEQGSQQRKEILENGGTYKVTQAFQVGGSYIGQLFQLFNTLVRGGIVIEDHALKIQGDVLSLGNSVRTAAGPISIADKPLKYSTSIWASNCLDSFAMGVSMPYAPVIALGLGAMEDLELWVPVTVKATDLKNSLISKFQGQGEKRDSQRARSTNCASG